MSNSCQCLNEDNCSWRHFPGHPLTYCFFYVHSSGSAATSAMDKCSFVEKFFPPQSSRPRPVSHPSAQQPKQVCPGSQATLSQLTLDATSKSSFLKMRSTQKQTCLCNVQRLLCKQYRKLSEIHLIPSAISQLLVVTWLIDCLWIFPEWVCSRTELLTFQPTTQTQTPGPKHWQNFLWEVETCGQ